MEHPPIREIEPTAESIEKAVEIALEIQRDPDSLATHLTVVYKPDVRGATNGEEPMNIHTKPKFHLGEFVATPGALQALERNNTNGREYLQRHLAGDWGAICEEDAYLNDMAIQDGSRILSAYLLPDETKIWIITDAEIDEQHNRQATTFLLPEEY